MAEPVGPGHFGGGGDRREIEVLTLVDFSGEFCPLSLELCGENRRVTASFSINPYHGPH